MKRVTLLCSLVVLAAWVGGCSESQYTRNILEHRKNLVGGGLFIDYTAPENGTVIYADSVSGKILATKSLLAGEKFEMNLMKRDDAEKILENYLDMSRLKPQLYFIPNTQMEQKKK